MYSTKKITFQTISRIFILLLIVLTASLAISPNSNADDICGQYSVGGPPFLPDAVPPLVMLVMGRDHKLYYEAYNDASDLNDDGELDVGYKPDKIDYYGYFDSYKCYDYSSTNNRFEPQAFTEDKKCSSVSGGWSGDFLNYLTMSRMDTIRKVLYGGYRSTDSDSDTVLERVFIPQDAHSWGKEYTGLDQDGYDIEDYSPLSLPMSGRRHFFASTTLSDDGEPLLRVLENAGHTGQDYRIWNWAAIERPVAGSRLVDGENGPKISDLNSDHGGYNLTDYSVHVQVCKTDLLEPNCKTYPGDGTDPVYKPTGLLQKYGEGDSMFFGLMTGSYENNMSGGVVRKNIGSISDEINPATGMFTATNGIINTINNLRIVNFRYSDHSYEPGWSGAWVTNRPMNEGEFPDWGNPIAEMMYEGLRYFAGENPDSDFEYTESGSVDSALNLPLPIWTDPFNQNDQNLYCAKPIMLVISDIYPSYDSDQLPGSAFPATGWSSGQSLGADTLNVQNRLNDLSSDITGDYFTGQSNTDFDSSCNPKGINGLGNVRGLCPEEPTKQGSYYSGAVSHYGRNTDLRTDLTDEQKVSTFAVALSSPIPEINIPVGNQTITLVPFGKTVKASGLDSSEGEFQPTNTIVDFFVEDIAADRSSGTFRINFEDVEQGADHDMDVIVLYEYEVKADNTVEVTLTKEYQAAGYTLHIGYIISGTTNDGIYLDVASKPTDVKYFLDTPVDRNEPGRGSSDLYLHCTGPADEDCVEGENTQYSRSRTFTPGSTPAASLLEDPLWYAAKWGGYEEDESGNIEWDKTGDGIPDHYFYVTNPLRLEQQLSRAFQLMLSRIASGAAASVLSTSRRGEGAVAQAVFWPSKSDDDGNEVSWSGDVRTLRLDLHGQMKDTEDKTVTYFFDTETERTRACVDGEMTDGSCSGGSVKELDEINYLWTAADWLNDLSDASIPTNRDSSHYNDDTGFRYIFTWNDGDNDGIIDSNEVVSFDIDNVETIFSWKNLGSDADTKTYYEKVINWIRGKDQADMREREYEGKTWRLGDIIYSSPVMVGAPSENYDLLWNEPSYGKFYREYRDRRAMVYFGANDGMLHAVNAGFFTSGVGFETGDGGPPLGAEMWAYVPYNLLPHLECLTDPNYSHQYYVDLRPRIFDARIFPESDKHPGGWGTILVGGMRLGGGYIPEDSREFTSSFFVLDITDPEEPPTLLGETTYETGNKACSGDKPCINFGYTVSVPTVVPVKDSNDVVKWFLVLSTGPDSDMVSVESTQKAKIAVIPMEDYLGDDSHANWSNLRVPDNAPTQTQSGRKQVPNNNSFISTGMVSVDYDMDFFVDILYFGTTEGQGQTIGGGLQRLKIEGDEDPGKWEYKSMVDAGRPVTGEPNIGWHEGDVWVYFGTGKFWTARDKTDDSVEAVYCIKEPKQTNSNAYNFAQVGGGSLEDVSDIVVSAEEGDYGKLLCMGGGTDCLPSGVETFWELQDEIVTSSNIDGAYRELPAGERILGQPSLFGGLTNYTAYHPDPDNDVCASEGESKLYSLHHLTCIPWVKDVFGGSDPEGFVEADGDGYVRFTQELGPGMTITPSLHLGEQEGTTIFIQTSTGEIISVDQPELATGTSRSGRGSWHTIDIDCEEIDEGQSCPKP